MKTLKTPLILAAAGFMLAPTVAYAGAQSSVDAMNANKSVQSQTLMNPKSQTTLYAAKNDSAVLTAVSTAENNDLIRVRDNDGNIHYNHVLTPSELTEVDYDLEIVDTYSFNYQGQTYTNKIVKAD